MLRHFEHDPLRVLRRFTELPAPVQETYKLILARMTPSDIERARNAIEHAFDDIANDDSRPKVEVSSFIPGDDWSNNEFQPIYVDAARHDWDVARKMFGILVQVVIVELQDMWGCGRYPIRTTGFFPEGLTYW